MKAWTAGILTCIAILSTSLPLTPNAAQAAEPTPAELQRQIESLQAQLDELKAQQAQRAGAQEVQATTRAVHDDAERRSRLGVDASGLRGSYSDSKLVFRTEDGSFSVRPSLQLQVRQVSTYRELEAGGDDWQSGFELRRLKLGLEGNVFTPDLTYNVIWATNRKDGVPELEAGYLQYRLTDTPYAIKFGQFKNPLDHEQLSSTKYTAAVDRTLIDDLFAGGEGYVQGVSFIYDPQEQLRLEAAITDGLGSLNENFEDFPATSATWGAAMRAEYKLFGRWKDYDRFTLYSAKEETLVAGLGGDYTEAGDLGMFTHVVDMHYVKPRGVGLYGAYLGRFTKGGGVVDRYDPTLRVQASYALSRRWEPFIQYEFIDFDGASFPAGTETQVHIFRIGTSYYLYGENARLQFDLSYLPNGSPVEDDGTGILLNNGENEWVFRAQFQLLL